MKVFNVFNIFRKPDMAIDVNVMTLSFCDKNIEKKFRNEYYNKSLVAFRISFITVMLLYAAFGYLDYATSEDFYKIFFVIRYLIVLPVLLGVFLFSFSKHFKKIWQGLISISYIAGGSGIIFMLIKNPDNIYYYGGMFLIFTAGYFFIKQRFFATFISSLLLIMFYNIGSFLFPFQFEYLLLTNAFYISVNIMSMLALYNIELFERKDFFQRSQLTEAKNEITLINQSLEIKVYERTKLLDEQTKLLNEGNTNLLDEISNRKKIEGRLLIAKKKAEESDRLKSAFLANMSHEIRTPMNGILGFSDLLKNPNLTGEQQQKYIGIIEKGGERMLNIINDIISISKIESGQMEVNIQESNINKQIEYIYTFFKPEIEGKGMQFSFRNSLPSSEAILKTDTEKVYAILTNLVKNAIKYSKKGSIEIGYTKRDKFLEFYIKDTGIGIPKDRQKAIFERFIQADIEDKMARQGAGLGLSISRAYAEILGGKIWVESEEGKGSTFYFTLPYQTETINENSVEKDISLPIENSLINKFKILIVEDDEASDMLITAAVQKIAKEIISVTTGLEAVEACHKNPDIDLVLMDIQLPEMNGYEATRQIRKFNKEIVIIAQTAFGLYGDKEKAIAAGCNDYLPKPIKIVDLNKMIVKYLNT